MFETEAISSSSLSNSNHSEIWEPVNITLNAKTILNVSLLLNLRLPVNLEQIRN